MLQIEIKKPIDTATNKSAEPNQTKTLGLEVRQKPLTSLEFWERNRILGPVIQFRYQL